jgi:hypothetical protein
MFLSFEDLGGRCAIGGDLCTPTAQRFPGTTMEDPRDAPRTPLESDPQGSTGDFRAGRLGLDGALRDGDALAPPERC